MQFLIERGVNINHTNAKQLSPYILAKRHSDKEIIQLLMDAGCKTNEDYLTTTTINTINGYHQSSTSHRKKANACI